MADSIRPFEALVWIKGEQLPPKRLTVMARDLLEAERMLRDQFQTEIEFSLYNKEDAESRRV